MWVACSRNDAWKSASCTTGNALLPIAAAMVLPCFSRRTSFWALTGRGQSLCRRGTLPFHDAVRCARQRRKLRIARTFRWYLKTNHQGVLSVPPQETVVSRLFRLPYLCAAMRARRAGMVRNRRGRGGRTRRPPARGGPRFGRPPEGRCLQPGDDRARSGRVTRRRPTRPARNACLTRSATCCAAWTGWWTPRCRCARRATSSWARPS